MAVAKTITIFWRVSNVGHYLPTYTA